MLQVLPWGGGGGGGGWCLYILLNDVIGCVVLRFNTEINTQYSRSLNSKSSLIIK